MAKILIVEDYPSIQKIYQTALAAEGYEVSLAEDGEQALSQAENLKPDLILLDLLMTNVSGLEFLRAYNLTKHPTTKVIIVSNLSSPELAKEAKSLGVVRYLIKSKVSLKELSDIVREVLGG